ncbi:MAG: fatty acyl-AMP ligase [Deltaproteobacteria bacterium]|nr:fatty acyl-AMP ligase [Deltaproteobacteria bacterium]
MPELTTPKHRKEQFLVGPDESRKAHVSNPNPCNLAFETLVESLERMSKEDGTYLNFLDYKNQSNPVTWKEAWAGAVRYATFLRNRGLKRGTKVVLLMPTGKDFLFAMHGIQLAGGVPVPCAPPHTLGELDKYLTNLRHIVRNCEAEFIISDPRFKIAIGTVMGDRNSVRHLLMTPEVVDEPAKFPGEVSVSGEDAALIQYTSGTTHLPKGVVLTHRNLLSNVYGIGVGLERRPSDVALGWLPLFHDMGLIGVLYTSLYWRYPVHVMAPEIFLLHPNWWLENISKFKVTLCPAPNFAYHLCARRISDTQLSKLDLSSWRIALNGAEPVDHGTVEEFTKRFASVGFGESVILPVYGMAENSLAATFPDNESPYETELVDRESLEGDGKAKPANGSGKLPYAAVSVGYPLAGQQVRIANEAGQTLDERAVGEILVRSPSITAGYYHNEEESARVLKDGWLHTGDLGYISQRRLFVTGRKKEMIIKRGRNYYPYDIERIASTVSGVRKGCLAAFACFNNDTGTEDLVLVAETREVDRKAQERMETEINGELLAGLGIRADRLVLVPPKTIPKTSSGKIQRVSCRERYLKGQLQAAPLASMLSPVKTVIQSFLGHQAFRFRKRGTESPQES